VHFPAAPQANPPAQGLAPSQHGWPAPPQATQLAPEQIVPAALQTLPAQHGWFTPPPQATQLAPEQIVPAALQTLPAQHAWLAPPQARHCPDVHKLPRLQTEPQQVCVVAPQETQVLPNPQTVTPGVQPPPAQQGWLRPPHSMHPVPEHE